MNQKTEALNSFKDSESSVKVILLSLAKAASGSNLIQASHVVLIGKIINDCSNLQIQFQEQKKKLQLWKHKPLDVRIDKDKLNMSLLLDFSSKKQKNMQCTSRCTRKKDKIPQVGWFVNRM